MALDRYIAVRKALRYHALVTPEKVRGVVASIWVYSFTIFYLVPLLGWNRWKPNISCHLTTSYTKDFILTFSVHILLDILAIVLLYGLLFREAALQKRKMLQSSNEEQRRAADSLRLRIRPLVTLSIVVGIYAACWVPTLAMMINLTVQDDLLRGTDEVYSPAKTSLILLIFTNSACNPLIYAYKVPEFRAAFRRLLECRPHNQIGWYPENYELILRPILRRTNRL